MQTSVTVVAWFQFVLLITIFTPLCAYGYYKLYQNRNKDYFIHRNVPLVALLMTYSTVGGIYFILMNHTHGRDLCLHSLCKTAPIAERTVISIFLLDGLYICFFARQWLLFFNLKWNEEISNIEWIKVISIDSDHSFFLRNKNSYIGSFGKLKYVLLLVYIIILATLCPIAFGHPHWFGMINGVHLIIFSFLQFILFYITPKDDVFKIRTEIGILFAEFVMVGLYFGITIPFQLTDRHIWFAAFNSCVIILSNAATNMILLYPVWYFEYYTKKDASTQFVSVTFDMAWTQFVAKSKKHFDKFMTHLCKECASENLCFILEVIQFKQANIQFNDNERDGFGTKIDLPMDELPKSSLVYGLNEKRKTRTVKEQAVLLIAKYIAVGSDMQVNVSHQTREAIIENMNNVNNNNDDMSMLIFDKATDDVARMLTQSWSRCVVQMMTTNDSTLSLKTTNSNNATIQTIKTDKCTNATN